MARAKVKGIGAYQLYTGDDIKRILDEIELYQEEALRPFPPPTTEESPDFKHDILVLRFLWASGLMSALSFVSGYFWKGLF